MSLKNKCVAIVCDWIKDIWWAELVLEHILEIFPNAHIYTSVFWQNDNYIFKWKKIFTSFIQKIPILNKSHKLALTLRPLAFERFDLSKYDIVISMSSAESKWVITKPDSLHIVYCHTPTRYFWSHYKKYLNMMEFGLLNPIWKWFLKKKIKSLRERDFIASQRADYFLANSKNTKKRIEKYYKRDSKVIYPWIDTKNFIFNDKKEDFYLYVWRCIPYKKFDLLIETFNKNSKKLILVTNTDNKLYRKLKKQSQNNITWRLNISLEERNKLYSKAKAFLFPPEEDFWLVPIEAMASWTPVIAYEKWWALETVIEWETWVFFKEQTTKNLNKIIDKFETLKFDAKKIREYAKKFDKKIFQKNIIKFIEKKIEK